MLRLLPVVLLFSFAHAAEQPSGAWSVDWTVYGQIFDRVDRNRPDDLLRINDDLSFDVPGYLAPRLDEATSIRFAGVAATLFVQDWLLLRGAVDTGGVRFVDGEVTTNGRGFEEEVTETGLLREAYAEASWGPVQIGAGKRNRRIGGGLVYDEYATGGSVAAEAFDLRLESGVWLLGRELVPSRGPVLTGRLGWSLDETNEVYVFASLITDDAAAAEELAQAMIDSLLVRRVGAQPLVGGLALAAFQDCARVEAEARPWVAGGGADLLFAGHTIHLVALVGRGSAHVAVNRALQSDSCVALLEELPPELQGLLGTLQDNVPWGEREIDLASFAVDATWRMRITSWLYPGAAFTWLSGNDEEFQDLTVYLAPAPYLPRSTLFFGGGLGTGFETRSASAAGVLARGVIAPALTALFVPHDQLELELAVLKLYADESGPFSDDLDYGTEVDLNLRWAAHEALVAQAEAGALRLGGFYPQEGTWWRVSVGLEAVFPP